MLDLGKDVAFSGKEEILRWFGKIKGTLALEP